MDFTDLLDFVEGTERSSLLLYNCVTRIEIEENSKSLKISVQLITIDPTKYNAAKKFLESKGLSFVEKSIEREADQKNNNVAYLSGAVNLVLALIKE